MSSTAAAERDFVVDVQPLPEAYSWSHRTDFVNQLLSLWDPLRDMSFDAALTSNGGILGFAERCLFFGTIHVERFVNVKPTKKDDDESLAQESPQTSGNTGQTCKKSSMHSKNGEAQTALPSLAPLNVGKTKSGKRVKEESSEPPVTKKIRQFAGVVYLASPPSVGAEIACEASVGSVLFPAAQGKGIGSYAVRHVLSLAFGTFAFHRVSAHVVGPRPAFDSGASVECGDSKGKGKDTSMPKTEAQRSAAISEKAVRFFVGLGFSHEGTRRRAVPGNLISNDGDAAWRDATTLAMLDTEWFYTENRVALRTDKAMNISFASDSGLSTVTEKSTGKKYVRRSRWDELLARHQREQEALAAVEGKLKRSSSTETIKAGANVEDVLMAPPGSLAPSSAADTASDLDSLPEAELLFPTDTFPGGSNTLSTTDFPTASNTWIDKDRAEAMRNNEGFESDVLDFVGGSGSQLSGYVPVAGVIAALPNEWAQKVEGYLQTVEREEFTPGPPPSDADEGDPHSDIESASELGDSVSVAQGRGMETEYEMDDDDDFDDAVTTDDEAPNESLLHFVPKNVRLHVVNAASSPSVSSADNSAVSQSGVIVPSYSQPAPRAPQTADPFSEPQAVQLENTFHVFDRISEQLSLNAPHPIVHASMPEREAATIPTLINESSESDSDYPETDMDMETGDESDACEVRAGSGSDWERVSHPATSSPPGSVVSATSSWTNASA